MKTSNDQTTQLLQADWKRLESGAAWPAATALGVRELAFTYYDAGFKVDLNINDYDGQLTEVLSSSTGDADIAENLQIFRRMVQSASGLIFLFPYGEQTDDDRMRKFRDEINTFLSLVEQGGVNRDPLSIPTVIAVNKWDRAPEFGQADETRAASEYLEATPVYRDAVARLRTFLPNHVVIPISTQRPSEEFSPSRPDVEPHNLLEPLRFIIQSVFSKFEQEYAALSSATGGDGDKQRFLLLSAYHREIQNLKGYAEDYEAIERRIAERFEADFIGLEAREIDARMSANAWFFDAVRSAELKRRFDQLRFGALVETFKTGLDKARGSAADLDIFRKENAWLFERLSEHPEYEQSYEAAVARVANVEHASRLKRIGLIAAAIPAALFLIWTLVENVIEGRRYDQVAAMRSDPANFARCETAGSFISDYEGGFRPLVFAGGHLREARDIQAEVQNAVASRILDRINHFNSGNAPEIAAVAQEFNAMVQASDRCLPSGQMVGNRSPQEELRALSEPLQAALTFVERASAAPSPPQGCSDITSLASSANSVSNYAQDVRAQGQRIRSLNAQCDIYRQCNAHRSNARSARGYAEFRTLLAGDNISLCFQAQSQGMFPEGLEAALGQDRDQTYARLDTDARSRLLTRFTTGQQLDDTRALIRDMRLATAPMNGVAGVFTRSNDIVDLMSGSDAAVSEYANTRSIYIGSVVFTSNTYPDRNDNPLNFECSSTWRDRSVIEAEFAGVYLSPVNCSGRGPSSALQWGVRNFSIGVNERVVFAPRRINPRWNGRVFQMRGQTLTITRDNIFQLKANGSAIIPVPGSAYTITLFRE